MSVDGTTTHVTNKMQSGCSYLETFGSKLNEERTTSVTEAIGHVGRWSSGWYGGISGNVVLFAEAFDSSLDGGFRDSFEWLSRSVSYGYRD